MLSIVHKGFGYGHLISSYLPFCVALLAWSLQAQCFVGQLDNIRAKLNAKGEPLRASLALVTFEIKQKKKIRTKRDCQQGDLKLPYVLLRVIFSYIEEQKGKTPRSYIVLIYDLLET